jgi:poly(3-hydroxybutyrate) depolymerase
MRSAPLRIVGLALLLLPGCSSSSASFSNGEGGDGGVQGDGSLSGRVTSDGGAHTDGASGEGGGTASPDGGSTKEGGDTKDAGGGPSTLTPGQSTISMTVAGYARSAILYVPSIATSTSQFAIALHGDGDTDTNFLATSGLKSLADADGTVLVVPQGITRDIVVDLGGGETQTVPDVDWDAYNSAANGNIDLPFLDQLRTQTVGTGQVDANHVFVFGYSQGGYLSFEYGMVTGASLSCSAVLAASSPYGGGSGDPLIAGAARKIPVVLQIGTLDSAYAAAQATESTLIADGFPTELNAIDGAGHVPIPGDVSVPWDYCRGEAL